MNSSAAIPVVATWLRDETDDRRQTIRIRAKLNAKPSRVKRTGFHMKVSKSAPNAQTGAAAVWSPVP